MRRLFSLILILGCGNSASKPSAPPIDPDKLSFAEAMELAGAGDARERKAGVAALERQGPSAGEQLHTIAGDPNNDVGRRCSALRAAAALGRDAEGTRKLAESMLPTATLTDCAKIALRQTDGRATLSFDRVAVLGASVSAGFGGAPVGQLLDESLSGEHQVQSVADTFFYMSPFEKGRDQVQRAAALDPTAVFALDTLFWFVYVSASAEQRLARLEHGLEQLEAFSAPLLVGDIPHMRDAHPVMIAPEAIPPPEQLARFNQRIREWARPRTNVYVIPFSDWVGPLLRGEEVVITPGKPPEPSAALMTFDKLHPNEAGVRYILRKLDAAIEQNFPDTAPDAL